MLIADYAEPRARIRNLADPSATERAVFLEGAQHYGKSYLLESLRPELEPKLVVVPLDKRRTVPAPIDLLTEIASVLGPEHFPALFAAIADANAAPRPQATVSNVSVNGSYNRVEAIAQESEEDRLIRAVLVTRGFLDDVEKLPASLRPLILAFDGYDAATMTLIDRWFDRSLVPGLARIDHVRLVVCGREVLQLTVKDKVKLGCCGEVQLEGIMDEKDWLPIITALKRLLPGDAEPVRISYLRGVISAFKGAPGLIMAHISSLQADG